MSHCETDSDIENNTTKPIKFGVGKYKNIMGITCYMNSILHILQHVPIFMEWITQAKFRDVLIRKIEHKIIKQSLPNTYETREKLTKEFVIFELFRLFNISMANDDSSMTPTSFKKLIGTKNDMWNEHNHQDSQEFFTFFVSQLGEEVGMKSEFIPGLNYSDSQTDLTFADSIYNITATNSWIKFQSREYSPLTNIFNGLIETNKRCLCCYSSVTTYEPYITLGLSIPIKNRSDMLKSFTIYDCLNHLIKEEQLDADNRMSCEMCGLKNQGHTQSLFWRTPKVLVLHIKRFLVNSFGIPTQKLNNVVHYPIKDLDLSRYFNPASPFKSNSKYDLIGINLHESYGFGGNINHGHYTSMIKNIINNNWYLYNDGQPIITIQNAQQLQNSNVYLLFYYCQN
jgi:ubiquitin C-terminal hydrolase